ncbi:MULTISPECIES: carbohydrate kinase [unclassified Paenibacillus]|uniref:carbohydrate kinase family protein n=1 Tax=unclassified Paenibacillus TaxID=185978 RepID=UPI001AE2FE48|nr:MULTISPECIES: carbohydrate kinase [unclassified Paenibacillus]MBP1156401.1 fructokinase [Paenibacillus sp. PvP091]MBP1168213.1 fructokinase [Paenibacillus sp. PvR098]MBP2439241.1 fructokinase [Paenibacillus sp. PvP052]
MNQAGLVVCVGELLIDFFCTDIDVDLKKGDNFIKQAGGAPANVSAAIAKLGGTASFVGKVGNDPFGGFLIDVLDQAGVDTQRVSKDDAVRTTMAFVSLQANGERDFVFYRGADERLTMADVDLEYISHARVMHFGSATALLGGEALETYFSLIDLAKAKNMFISFDPNFRTNLWQGREDEFIERARRGIGQADFVKVSDEELRLITTQEDMLEGVRDLHHLGARVIAVTLGKEGTLISSNGQHAVIPSVPIKSVDSTGAGDSFVGATLFQLAQAKEPAGLCDDFDELKRIIAFSNKVGAIVCTKVGAIAALPSLEEVERFG